MAVKVVKKDHVREPFDPEKIRCGLAKACWKRPVSDQQIEAIVSHVEREIYKECDSEVEASELGEMVMNQLAKVDQVAYVRFASVYREFTDVKDFVNELQPMLRKSRADGGPKRPQ